MTHDWYEEISGPELQQGDILKDSPVFRVSPDLDPVQLAASLKRGDKLGSLAPVRFEDLIILTQTCDIERDEVTTVLGATVFEWSRNMRPD